MKACADEFNKEYEKSRAIHPIVDNFGDERKDAKDSSDDDEDTFFTRSKGKCTRIEKTQSVIIENYDDPGTPMQDSPHSPQYSPISYHNYSPPNHSPAPSTYECRSDEDAVKRARMNDKKNKESSDEQDSELTCLKSTEDDAEKDSEAIIAPAKETETRIEQVIEHTPMITVVNVESNISDVPVA
jgi:hypothetical protein